MRTVFSCQMQCFGCLGSGLRVTAARTMLLLQQYVQIAVAAVRTYFEVMLLKQYTRVVFAEPLLPRRLSRIRGIAVGGPESAGFALSPCHIHSLPKAQLLNCAFFILGVMHPVCEPMVAS